MGYQAKDRLLTAQAVIIMFGITRDQLDTLRLKRGLPYVEVGKGAYIFSERELWKWVGRNLINKQGSVDENETP